MRSFWHLLVLSLEQGSELRWTERVKVHVTQSLWFKAVDGRLRAYLVPILKWDLSTR